MGQPEPFTAAELGAGLVQDALRLGEQGRAGTADRRAGNKHRDGHGDDALGRA